MTPHRVEHIANRVPPLFAGLWLIFFCGCSSFHGEWKRAAATPPPAGGITGRWEGHWRSKVNDHTGQLRCLVSELPDGRYQARFHAHYWKIFRFGYTVPLDVEAVGDGFDFKGDTNLGWYAGGVYHYEGHATPTEFDSTYRSKHDHGIFRMTRPEAAEE